MRPTRKSRRDGYQPKCRLSLVPADRGIAFVVHPIGTPQHVVEVEHWLLE
jgi:hypothetical protein